MNRQLSVSLPQSTIEQLRQEAARQRRPVSWVVADALSLYLSKVQQKEQAREEVAG